MFKRSLVMVFLLSGCEQKISPSMTSFFESLITAKNGGEACFLMTSTKEENKKYDGNYCLTYTGPK